jgi:hypothetical protein
MNAELALTRDWYERAAWLSEAEHGDAELTECVAELRTRVQLLEMVAGEMAATLQMQRETIDQFIRAMKEQIAN